MRNVLAGSLVSPRAPAGLLSIVRDFLREIPYHGNNMNMISPTILHYTSTVTITSSIISPRAPAGFSLEPPTPAARKLSSTDLRRVGATIIIIIIIIIIYMYIYIYIHIHIYTHVYVYYIYIYILVVVVVVVVVEVVAVVVQH